MPDRPERIARGRGRRRGCLAIALSGLGFASWPASGEDRSPVASTSPPAIVPSFEQHVRPILKAHCFDCHGEGDERKGDLDVRLKRLLERGGKSGAAIVPGDPDASLMLRLVRSGEMPKRDRKPTPAEIEVLRAWIEAGAKTIRPEPESLGGGMQITAEERSHWAFRPLRRPPIPTVPGARVRNPIDAFLAAAQTGHSVTFSPDAPLATRVRRAFLSLWGVQPTPSDLDVLMLDTSGEGYARLVERLLASPFYGERWARHWLDVAGYADSDGYTNDDTPRPYAYKYRDYVIRALNEDKPFDRFVTEQLAGDELALARHGDLARAARDPVARDWLIATGYLRMAADGTATGGIDQDTARNQVIADTLKIVSTSLLGLSVGCAQCHDHRYDPIPQTDYYRLRAVFEPAYDWKQWRTPAERRISLATDEDRAKSTAVEEEASKLSKEREAKQTEFVNAALKLHLEKFAAELREPLWNAFKTPAEKRTPEQKKLLADHPSANINAGVLYQYNPKAADELKAMEAKINEVRARKPVEDFISVLSEPVGTAPVTYRFHRGDPKQPKDPVAPGALTVLAPEGSDPLLPEPEETPPTSRRRLAFAKWMTGPDNPLLARVIVNRVWMHHFGRGLVGTPADLGLTGERPSHPELLEWLATAFAAPVDDHPERLGLGWSLKRLHQLILTSTAFQQSSARSEALDEADPENRLYGRMSVTRLDAEAIRDSLLAVSGCLNDRAFGPPVPVREDAVGQVVIGIDKKVGDNKMPVEVSIGQDEFRRSVYVEVRRSRPLAFLNAFDAPVMEVNCEKRSSSTVAPQSLMLMNSEFALQQARLLAGRLRRDAGPLAEARVERAWRLVFLRGPTRIELDSALEFLKRQKAAMMAKNPSTPAAESGGKTEDAAPEDRAMQNLCQALLSSNEFLYVD